MVRMCRSCPRDTTADEVGIRRAADAGGVLFNSRGWRSLLATDTPGNSGSLDLVLDPGGVVLNGLA